MEQETVTKGQVNRAGKVLRDGNAPAEMLDEARSVLCAWRNMHVAPSADISMLLGKYTSAKGQWPEALVARRLKRMPSIIGKLRRFPEMQAGCRTLVACGSLQTQSRMYTACTMQ